MLRATMYVHIAMRLAVDVSIERHQSGSATLQRRVEFGWSKREFAASAGGGQEMVFRKDKGGDSFQRQISALRQQLGGAEFEEVDEQVTMRIRREASKRRTSLSRQYEVPVQSTREIGTPTMRPLH